MPKAADACHALEADQLAALFAQLAEPEHHLWLSDRLALGFEWADSTRRWLRLNTDITDFGTIADENQLINIAISRETLAAFAPAGFGLIHEPPAIQYRGVVEAAVFTLRFEKPDHATFSESDQQAGDLTNRLRLRMTVAGKLLQSVAAWLTPKRGESTESPPRPACFVHADELDWYSHFCRNCGVRSECGRGTEIQTLE